MIELQGLELSVISICEKAIHTAVKVMAHGSSKCGSHGEEVKSTSRICRRLSPHHRLPAAAAAEGFFLASQIFFLLFNFTLKLLKLLQVHPTSTV